MNQLIANHLGILERYTFPRIELLFLLKRKNKTIVNTGRRIQKRYVMLVFALEIFTNVLYAIAHMV